MANPNLITAKAVYDFAVDGGEDVTEHAVLDKTTSAGSIVCTVATAALTAGKFEVYVEYYISETSA
mgnify:CR=1 FL=1